MQKRHFIALADHLRLPGQMPAQIDRVFDHYGLENMEGFKSAILDAITTELADFCKSQNGHFDRHRWIGYIKGQNGPSGGKVEHELSRSK